MTTNKVHYEWMVEYTDIHGDIHDIDAAKTYAQLMRIKSAAEGLKPVIVLVRSEGNESQGVTHRCWCYPKGEAMPKRFMDEYGHEIGINVPKRFLKEHENHTKKVK